MPACAICLEPDPDDGLYHRACLERLFGVSHCPALDLDLATFPARVQSTHDRMSVSGVQRKALLALSPDRRELLLAGPGKDGIYILKPQTERFPRLPENEHLSMCIGRALGLVVPEFGLVALRDGSWAYITRRFDRTADVPPRKLQQFDFCQLLDRAPELKAHGNAEECAEVVRKYTSDPQSSQRQLFLLFLTSFWLGNGDLHLKNISLLADAAGHYRLSPIYDLICTAIYDIKGQLLKISGRTHDLSHSHFVQLGSGACALPREEVEATIDRTRASQDIAGALIDRSFLPIEHKATFKKTLAKRSRALRPPRGR